MEVFNTQLSKGPSANIPPLEINLMNRAVPIIAELKKYSQYQREFLENFVSELCLNGMAYPNPKSAWAAAPLLVHKSGVAKWIFTVDLREVNKYTANHAYPTPSLEDELHMLNGSSVYANFDLSHAYWQIHLANDSQECQSFITPDSVYSNTRVLHGSTNADAHVQAALDTILKPVLTKKLLEWLDDRLLYVHSTARLLDTIE